jgi:hypothetical protein
VVPHASTYHGVAPLDDGQHPLTDIARTDTARINLTFRKVF